MRSPALDGLPVSSLSSHLVCALTHNLMVDPVLAADGHTYERAAILAWIASNRELRLMR